MSEDILRDKRVLYVEDDSTTREEVAFYLERSVYKLYQAGNGAEGLKLYQKYEPDLVITDIEMPVMDGLEMIKAIKGLEHKAPVIVTTAYYETNYLLSAVNIGVERYLLKPLDLKKMLEEMREVLSDLKVSSLCISLDDSDDVLDVNQSWSDYFGYEREEVLGKSFRAFIESDTPDGPAKGTRFRNGSPFRLRRKDGSVIQAVLGTSSSFMAEGTSVCTHYEIKTIETFMRAQKKTMHLLDRERFLRGLVTIHAMIGKAVVKASSTTAFLQEVTDIFIGDDDYEFAFIALLEDEGSLEISVQSQQYDLDLLDDAVRCLDLDGEEVCPTVEAIRKKQMVIIDDLSRSLDFPAKQAYEGLGTNAMISLPIKLMTQEQPLGVLTLLFEDANIYGSEELELFENIADTIAFGLQAIKDRIDNERLIVALDIQATTDALTGCINRHKGISIVKEEVKRAHRYDRPLSLLYLDIDHFKSINDTFGHERGDAVLIGVAESIRKVIRSSDSAVRWGGEEFIVILPESTKQSAVALAEKIRRELAKIDIDAAWGITASFGVAQLSPDEFWESLIMRADDLMYQAKNRGRNCIIHE